MAGTYRREGVFTVVASLPGDRRLSVWRSAPPPYGVQCSSELGVSELRASAASGDGRSMDPTTACQSGVPRLDSEQSVFESSLSEFGMPRPIR